MKSVPNRPRFKYAQAKGAYFFRTLGMTPPINPVQLIQTQPNWILKYDYLYGQDGFVVKKGDIYKIFIDSSIYWRRARFTVAHEAGHIVLRHCADYDYSNLTKEEIHILDIEADIFAGEILMPKKYILDSKLYTIEDLMDYFEVSRSAMETRLKYLNIQHIVRHPEDVLIDGYLYSDCVSLDVYLYKKEIFRKKTSF